MDELILSRISRSMFFELALFTDAFPEEEALDFQIQLWTEGYDSLRSVNGQQDLATKPDELLEVKHRKIIQRVVYHLLLFSHLLIFWVVK